MVDPVVAADGFTYERAAIEMWMRSKDVSPRTREPLVREIEIPLLMLVQFISGELTIAFCVGSMRVCIS
jgi:hypothetical protein